MKRNFVYKLKAYSVRVNGEGLSLAAKAGLDLSHDDGAHVAVLVHDGHHEGAVYVALVRGQRVDVRDERLLLEPRRQFAHGVQDALAVQTRDRHELYVLRGIEADLFQVGCQTVFAVIVSKKETEAHDSIARFSRLKRTSTDRLGTSVTSPWPNTP